jgi:uncharacterized protein YdeI (YjbR/CyaY-like superfamily)
MLRFRDAAEWEAWLAGHHEEPDGAWLVVARKGRPGIAIGDALNVALCYGWIDSQRKAHDATSFLQRYSRRRPGSPWSRINVERAEALIEAGRMRPPGLAEVEAAKADGRWDAAYESQRTAAVPSDLATALAENPAAATVFAALSRTDRYAVILPVLKARTPAGRAARVERAVAQLRSVAPPAPGSRSHP